MSDEAQELSIKAIGDLEIPDIPMAQQIAVVEEIERLMKEDGLSEGAAAARVIENINHNGAH